MEIAKMLLNLNESCDKEYRELLVTTIIRIICVYAKEFLRENPFLR